MEEEILEEEIQVQEENYVVNADLSDYYTKEETNDLLDEKADISDIPDISGKQDLITSSNKLSSDLVDDSLGTNKFVTSQEKTTWNGKQNALTFDSTPTLNSNNPVTSNGIAVAIGSIISKATYLGKITEFTSVANAIDLNSLPKGTYSLNVDRTSRTAIYLKARYNNVDITGSFEIYTGSDKIENDLVYITKTEDIPETEPYSSTTNCGYVSYTQGTNDTVYMYTKFIQLGSNKITFSTSYKQYNICTKDTNQSISGKKTFDILPESSVTPTTSNQLVNKQYVDDIVGNINTVLATLTTPQEDN